MLHVSAKGKVYQYLSYIACMIKIKVDLSIKHCSNRFPDFSQDIKGMRHIKKTFCYKRTLINAENIGYKLFIFVINYSNLLKN